MKLNFKQRQNLYFNKTIQLFTTNKLLSPNKINFIKTFIKFNSFIILPFIKFLMKYLKIKYLIFSRHIYFLNLYSHLQTLNQTSLYLYQIFLFTKFIELVYYTNFIIRIFKNKMNKNRKENTKFYKLSITLFIYDSYQIIFFNTSFINNYLFIIQFYYIFYYYIYLLKTYIIWYILTNLLFTNYIFK